ncbi:phosphoethanolamine transferase [Mesonia ostreae]|uniref:Phosphoethanolamine transferase n=1 Tax=Mesonia ostreae TaxID=861110 RepID=A0ABU2KKU3_9FLAO|nr:phosphoethanolamine transferase [Mesonia ostreae]MDT0295342.1 phosphoethanolamine transferase [Mesonia ostreae]
MRNNLQSDFFRWRVILLLIYTIILAFLLEISIHQLGHSTFLNVLENILFGSIIYFSILILNTFTWSKWLGNMLLVGFYLILLIETGLYILFETRFNASYIYVILNTNATEMSEFSQTFSTYYLLWLLLFLVPLFSFFPKRKASAKALSKTKLLISLGFILILAGALKFSKLIIYNLPYITVKSYVQYKEQIEEIEKFKTENPQLELETSTQNELIVIAVGESASRKHMQLYGYQRPTNPVLMKQDSLHLFNDVISSHVYTMGSIYDVFTLANYENPKASKLLMHYLKSANYKTYWLSNQRPVGFHDNLISKLASVSNETTFFNYSEFNENGTFDEVLLPLLDETMQKEGKKVIFLHLAGNHYAYNKRYPTSFNYFTSDDDSEKTTNTNTYDNAIRYNDYVLSEVLDLIQQQNEKSAFLYFSDHGEEMYDVSDYFGHFEDKPTSTMYEIPFIFWKSPSFETPSGFTLDTSRPYMLDDFPHTLTHLMGISAEDLETSRSIFSDSFQPRKRMIQDGTDFEEFKKSEKK